MRVVIIINFSMFIVFCSTRVCTANLRAHVDILYIRQIIIRIFNRRELEKDRPRHGLFY